MTATIVPPFLEYTEVNKNNKMLNYNNNTFGGPHNNGSSLLDRKAVGGSGLLQRCDSVTLPNAKFNQNQFINSLKVDPFSLLIGGCGSKNKENCFRDRSFSETGERLKPGSQLQGLGIGQSQGQQQVNSSRYKTELCRPFEENGTCKYGDKCQFAHGMQELRSLSRHPKYKTELCRTFHTMGFCPYGPRCHFIHNAEERRGPPPPLSTFNKIERPRLQHSFSFAGFPSQGGLQVSPTSVTPPPISTDEDMSDWPSKPFTYTSQELANLFGPSLGGGLSVLEPGLLTPATPSPTAPCFFRPMSESPASPPDSLSDLEGYQSSQSGSESPSLDASRRLPIFSRLSISDD
ncbi:mRNA decay activator protein ZFP36L1 isoform X1 [Salmo salar]|uniref:mRNA decay activator protein ZFP36 n=2 Tax=Salmo salar TaxID=8030 RepID=A0A1S3SAP6_SALSA|nr:mRNA decay activator protein ZFP36L1-like isoform X1 [Salmo salar]|eukprot:XP_014061411.1 PREDICTED: zinc finger protein 36, C3H1 type-like 1 isoform X1 [Salmo salar]